MAEWLEFGAEMEAKEGDINYVAGTLAVQKLKTVKKELKNM